MKTRMHEETKNPRVVAIQFKNKIMEDSLRGDQETSGSYQFVVGVIGERKVSVVTISSGRS